MRRTRIAAAFLLAIVASACADLPTDSRQTSGIIANSGTCTATLSSLLAQADTVFGAGAPNVNSVVGKLNNLDHHLNNNNPAEAKNRAFEIVAFVLQKERENDLAGTAEEIARFVNAIYCYAGLDITISDPANSWLIYPSDSAQIVYGLDSTTGISFPGTPVGEPSMLTVEPFNGTLNTVLDQFPGFIYIRLQNAGNTGLTGRVTISVCATGVPESVNLSDLRLGHGINDNAGFEITPLPTAADPVEPTLDCDTSAPSLSLAARMVNRVASLLSPRSAQASATMIRRFGGGVSGTANEFSPFAPVDGALSFGGGVSGTANEFIRTPSLLLEEGTTEVMSSLDPCSTTSVGADVPTECLPVVTIQTRTVGTKLEGVPVDWYVPATSGGTIAARSGIDSQISCGTFGRTASTVTTDKGNAGVCWNVSTLGTYTVVAKARVGGDAPEGVRFVNGATGADSVIFTVTVTPVTISIVAGNNQTAPAGSLLPIAPTVRVLDANGQPAANVLIDWAAFGNSDASVSATPTRTNSSGEAWTNWTIGAGYNELRAMVRNAPDTVAVYFTASGSSGTTSINSCPIGGGRDPINDPSRPYGFWVPGPANGITMREVDLYFGASGKANAPTTYQIALITRRGGGFLGSVVDTTIVPVELRGNASENKRATFRLRNPIVGRTGNASSSANAVAMRLVVISNPDGATLNFNTGPCPLGNCKPDRECTATEVNLNSVTTSKPLGDVFRRSVGIQIRGN
ncbi:hypothetical protein Strain138_002824 [Pseudogemmatithrix spongiicola]|uniref:Ig-like domain-containing protein n=1 Tax=Pseudogemmatithrix spongiicola TaxID=3062599 RepID=A0AA49Q838_9BACT|nr:hypothetical protein Strain138_002824 [Gemmatimonadaceae bacterium 'strain 138']WKW16408.1 hypothetical protein Strain318_002824 [Gemmatimonadaceae bacterium 'strain 318']